MYFERDSMELDHGIHSAFASGYEAKRSPMKMNIGERILPGHLRVEIQFV